MGVVEGTDVACPDNSVGERIEASRVGIGRLGLLELLEESVLLRQLGEDAGEISSLLRRSLSTVRVGRVRNRSAPSECRQRKTTYVGA